MTSNLTRRLARRTKQGLKSLTPPSMRPDALRTQLLEGLVRDGTVKGGPFQGLIFPTNTMWSGLESKLLGVYEAELYPIFDAWRLITFTHIIDIGSADGYYALGCAMIWPCVHVIAYEADMSGRKTLKEFAARNGFEERIECRAYCDTIELRNALQGVGLGLVVMDVEGYEDILLDATNANLLKNFFLIVELHDLRVESLGEKLTARFHTTHTISEIWTRRRQLKDFNYPKNKLLRLYLLEQLRQISDEKRGAPMRWFILQPKTLDLA